MRIDKILCVFFVILLSNALYAQDEPQFEKISQLSDEEKLQFEIIKTIYNDFEYSTKVIRRPVGDTEFSEMIFEKDRNGKYFGKYDEYSVTFKESSDFVRFKMTIGNTFKSEGTMFIIAPGVIKVERVCRKNLCEIKIFNGKKLLFSKKDN